MHQVLINEIMVFNTHAVANMVRAGHIVRLDFRGSAVRICRPADNTASVVIARTERT